MKKRLSSLCFYFLIAGLLFFIEHCNLLKHCSKKDDKALGLYVDVKPIGILSQYVFFDSLGKAYYYYDTTASYQQIAKRIKDRYRQMGNYRIKSDSILFSFDSCASTQTTITFLKDGVQYSSTHKIFDRDNPQRYYGRIAGDTIYFLLVTRDTLRWNETYVRCKK